MVDTEQMRHREYIILKTNTMCNLIIGVWNIIPFSWNVETQYDAAVCTQAYNTKMRNKNPYYIILHIVTWKLFNKKLYQTQSDYIMVVNISEV